MNKCVAIFASTVGQPIITSMEKLWPLDDSRNQGKAAIPLVAAILHEHSPSIDTPRGYEMEVWCTGEDKDCQEFFEDWKGWEQHAARKVVKALMEHDS